MLLWQRPIYLHVMAERTNDFYVNLQARCIVESTNIAAILHFMFLNRF